MSWSVCDMVQTNSDVNVLELVPVGFFIAISLMSVFAVIGVIEQMYINGFDEKLSMLDCTQLNTLWKIARDSSDEPLMEIYLEECLDCSSLKEYKISPSSSFSQERAEQIFDEKYYATCDLECPEILDHYKKYDDEVVYNRYVNECTDLGNSSLWYDKSFNFDNITQDDLIEGTEKSKNDASMERCTHNLWISKLDIFQIEKIKLSFPFLFFNIDVLFFS